MTHEGDQWLIHPTARDVWIGTEAWEAIRDRLSGDLEWDGVPEALQKALEKWKDDQEASDQQDGSSPITVHTRCTSVLVWNPGRGS
jgi:hypothetical protein